MGSNYITYNFLSGASIEKIKLLSQSLSSYSNEREMSEFTLAIEKVIKNQKKDALL